MKTPFNLNFFLMKKLSMLVAGLFLLIGGLHAQQNVVKVGLTPLAFGNVNLNYERVLTDRMSLNTTVGFGIPRNSVPFAANSGLEGNASYGAFEVTPELRFYGKDNGAPRGFYFGPWLRYRQWTISGDETFSGYSTNYEAGLRTFNGGIQLGAQWLIGDVFSIDWSFLGVGIGYYNLSGKFTSDDPSVDWDQVKADIETELGQSVDNVPGLDFAADNLGGEIGVKLPFFLPVFRSSIAIGFAF